ncbi:MAG: regulatory protein RecX [Betaproteobacteria bacterium]|nr:regulatory protein RecX [Betaproteobacteria bacterium]
MSSRPDNPQLISAALKLLARRDLSRQEFSQKLAHAGYTDTDIQAAIAWCSDLGWLNESRLAENAAQRLSQKYGNSRVAHTLRQKGLADEGIHQALAQLETSETERARIIWAKKFQSLPQDAHEKARQARYLQARGFGFDTIKKVLTPRQ